MTIGRRDLDLLTYEEASKEINRALSSIKRAITNGYLTPVKRPREQIKYLEKDQVLWFKNRPFNAHNAQEYQAHKQREVQETDQFLSGYLASHEHQKEARPPLTEAQKLQAVEDSWGRSPEAQAAMRAFAPVAIEMALKLMSDDLDEMDAVREELSQAIRAPIESAQDTERIRMFVRMAAEMLTRQDLSFGERRLYRRLLDEALDTLAAEQDRKAATA